VGRDVSEALQVLARGYSLPVDVASVNGRIFLNNSSIGLYPAMVAVRTRYEEKMSRWRAMIQAALLVLRHAPLISVDISDGEDTIHVTTRLLFVGNNQYELNLLSLGRRERLDAGELWCIVLDDSSRVRIIPNMLAFLQGNQPNERFFRVQSTTELKVSPRGTRRQIEVSADGEAFRVPIPLIYRVKPRSLKVIVPRPPPPESREARSVNSEEEPSSQAP
jgi:diacylglycerol kinase family enzyme